MSAGRAAGGGGVARCAAGAQVLAVRRRTLRDAAAGAYPRSRNGNPQRGHVPAATVRRPHDGHALAPAQDRSPSLRRLQACRAADARVGSVGRRSGLYVCCDGSDAGQHGRIPAGGVPAPAPGETGEMYHQRYLCAGRLRFRDRRVCRSVGAEDGGRAFRRPYGFLLADR